MLLRWMSYLLPRTESASLHGSILSPAGDQKVWPGLTLLWGEREPAWPGWLAIKAGGHLQSEYWSGSAPARLAIVPNNVSTRVTIVERGMFAGHSELDEPCASV